MFIGRHVAEDCVTAADMHAIAARLALGQVHRSEGRRLDPCLTGRPHFQQNRIGLVLTRPPQARSQASRQDLHIVCSWDASL